MQLLGAMAKRKESSQRSGAKRRRKCRRVGATDLRPNQQQAQLVAIVNLRVMEGLEGLGEYAALAGMQGVCMAPPGAAPSLHPPARPCPR